jgi:hypothetical protein
MTRSNTSGGDIVRRIETLVLSGGPVGRLYDSVCSHARILVSPKLIPYATLSAAALGSLDRAGGLRIFSSDDARGGTGSGRATAASPPPTCPLTLRTLGRATREQVMQRPVFFDCQRTYAGNWAILVRRSTVTPAVAPKYLTVCGFFECFGRNRFDTERLVKHVNLCTYARMRHRSAYAYLFTGTFVAGASRGRRTQVLVNTRSGTWALAKHLLVADTASIFEPARYDDMDSAVASFARPKVSAIVRHAIHAQ